MGFYEAVVRPLAFRLDPEAAHDVALRLISTGALRVKRFSHEILEQELFGVRFANPLGLAAGFDKNGVALDHWANLGFGFVEVGTVTPLEQPGNPKPRLFRLPKHRALVNRLGFNSEGCKLVASRLAFARPGIPVGINVGKNRDTPNDRAANDYLRALRTLSGRADYAVINVSSPNTVGLRELQERQALEDLLSQVSEALPDVKLFVKVSPDLTPSQLTDVVEVAHERRLTGIIAANTTLQRPGLEDESCPSGGLSGLPLAPLTDAVLEELYRSCDHSMTLIGVGGIMNADDLFRKLSLGAHLCQIYTGWVYGGPALVPQLLKRLVARMEAEGIRSLCELRGSAVKP
ncbi:MAG: quinone-dependent dihydroorotate dehydrogenase [Fimbriimonadaceae bacterium]|nr:Dihydroorotate dehydrogenase (quinone) [Fimbriimonadaceae bacterium]MCC6351435.1 quinone-dependent dihydroorotate dehydrogenase [Fimbriimonadaceae bacterium]